MQRKRSTKIIATLGPASSDFDTIAGLHAAGANLFRLNFSHGVHADHQARLTAIRAVEQSVGVPIGVMADLQGPKIRIGTITGGGVDLAVGSAYRLDMNGASGDGQRAPLPHPEVFAALEQGMDLLIDDGRIRLNVIRSGADFAECQVITGGHLSDRKGVNLPQTLLPVGPMTVKDQADLRFALDAGVDWVALSFVQRPEDIAEARRLIAGRAAIMAKIEKPAALHQIDEIIELADAIMVARGDLGVELPVEEVPALQKDLVRRARRAGKPVVVATQMLESMIAAPVPTRAEVSDVATAVYDGADAVMLSGETASGGYPIAAVAVMDRVAAQVEGDPGYRKFMDAEHADPEATSADAITAAARQVAETISATAIVTYTTSGSTALRAARERPPVPILVLTPSLITARRLAVAWGLICVHSADASGFTDMVDRACRAAADCGIAEPGDRLVITAGVPFGTPGATNSLRIAWVP
ncbi:MAG: pyruvate kinase [Alphaproteobacteria bacterium]|nr:pyruvate kinase [Alphaproteobacteria bacterium]